MKNHSMQRFGERNGRAKLTAEKVIEIRQAVAERNRLLAEGHKLRAQSRAAYEAARKLKNANIAKRHRVSEVAVKNAVYGANWKHVR